MNSIITAATLRERLLDSELPRDPLDVVMPPGDDRFPPDLRAVLMGDLKPAGVLVPVFQRDAGLSVLLTQRSAELNHHAGQVSFPGGRMEPDDADIGATALRETHEEVGIAPDFVEVLGYLRPMPTITGYAVTPAIGLVDAAAAIAIDRTEVEFTFEVPLDFLLDEANQAYSEREFRGRQVPIIEFRHDGHRIWGATAHVVIRLREFLLK